MLLEVHDDDVHLLSNWNLVRFKCKIFISNRYSWMANFAIDVPSLLEKVRYSSMAMNWSVNSESLPALELLFMDRRSPLWMTSFFDLCSTNAVIFFDESFLFTGVN